MLLLLAVFIFGLSGCQEKEELKIRPSEDTTLKLEKDFSIQAMAAGSISVPIRQDLAYTPVEIGILHNQGLDYVKERIEQEALLENISSQEDFLALAQQATLDFSDIYVYHEDFQEFKVALLSNTFTSQSDNPPSIESGLDAYAEEFQASDILRQFLSRLDSIIDNTDKLAAIIEAIETNDAVALSQLSAEHEIFLYLGISEVAKHSLSYWMANDYKNLREWKVLINSISGGNNMHWADEREVAKRVGKEDAEGMVIGGVAGFLVGGPKGACLVGLANGLGRSAFKAAKEFGFW
ncbi:MAG: hypothetical protein JJT94_13175 [Bernardetiaceae bacterium]|nr:hypothetical protein [Bernardetiaceae bacterium]